MEEADGPPTEQTATLGVRMGHSHGTSHGVALAAALSKLLPFFHRHRSLPLGERRSLLGSRSGEASLGTAGMCEAGLTF